MLDLDPTLIAMLGGALLLLLGGGTAWGLITGPKRAKDLKAKVEEPPAPDTAAQDAASAVADARAAEVGTAVADATDAPTEGDTNPHGLANQVHRRRK